MRQNRIAAANRVDRCPICQHEVIETAFTHINFVKGGHFYSAKSNCKRCDIDLIEMNGQWRTSKINWKDLGSEIDNALAYEIFIVNNLNNKFLADIYGMDVFSFNEKIHELWNVFTARIKFSDKLYTWRQDLNHGIAHVRDFHIIATFQFEST
jgi:hypothetical protein